MRRPVLPIVKLLVLVLALTFVLAAMRVPAAPVQAEGTLPPLEGFETVVSKDGLDLSLDPKTLSFVLRRVSDGAVWRSNPVGIDDIPVNSAKKLEMQSQLIVSYVDAETLQSGLVNSAVGCAKRASLTGLTYLYQGVLARNLDYLDPTSNWYARRLRRSTTLGRSWSDDDNSAYREVEIFFGERQKRQAPGAAAAGDLAAWVSAEWAKALPRLERVAAAHPEHPGVVYNLACARAQTGRLDEAMTALQAAAEAGFTDYRHVQKDEDLVPLRSRADFGALVERLRVWQAEMIAPCAFSAAVGWTPQGAPVAPYKGARYLLSTMLGVGSGRGNSFDEIVGGLRRSVAADGTRPAGTVYFMLNDDVRSTAREWAVHGAAAQVRAGGVGAEVETGVLPQRKADVAGAFVGATSFDWQASGSTILPGAICEHLTSFGGMFEESAGQTPLSEFIRYGAAGACGTVCEPFAIQAKFPQAFVQAYYTAGYTLAESLYLSVTGPYQLLVVGDALCAPWIQRGAATLSGMQPGQRADGVQRLQFEAGDARPAVAEVTWFVDGQRFAVLGRRRRWSWIARSWPRVGIWSAP
jgi:hypothetical protein